MVNLIKLTTLLDEAKCYEVIRQLRWPDGIVCLHCCGTAVVRNGHDDRERHRQRYLCKTCKHRFDDLTGTVLAGHHQPVSTWILSSYFMGVNLSNRQIAHELGLCESAAASRHLAGEAAALSRLLQVRSQRPQTRKGFTRLLDRGA